MVIQALGFSNTPHLLNLRRLDGGQPSFRQSSEDNNQQGGTVISVPLHSLGRLFIFVLPEDTAASCRAQLLLLLSVEGLAPLMQCYVLCWSGSQHLAVPRGGALHGTGFPTPMTGWRLVVILHQLRSVVGCWSGWYIQPKCHWVVRILRSVDLPYGLEYSVLQYNRDWLLSGHHDCSTCHRAPSPADELCLQRVRFLAQLTYLLVIYCC